MGGLKRALHTARERWSYILISCLALALAFGLGMFVQSRRAEAEDGLYSACMNMEEHLSSPETWLPLPYFQVLEAPMEDPGMKAEMAHVRRWAARIFEAELAYSLEEADVPVTHAYLYALSEELLGSSCPDAASAARLFSLCEPLENALEASGSSEELLSALEAELNTPAGQEALALLEIPEDALADVRSGT